VRTVVTTNNSADRPLEKIILSRAAAGVVSCEMITVAEMEAAIRALPPAERERLADDLPSILPELNSDVKWQRIIADPRPRPALTALGDEIAAQLTPRK
jgi:hypothetical protein